MMKITMHNDYLSKDWLLLLRVKGLLLFADNGKREMDDSATLQVFGGIRVGFFMMFSLFSFNDI